YEEGMFHVWPLIEMPETRRARNSIVAFLSSDKTTRQAESEAITWSVRASSSGPFKTGLANT
ncbi:MAG: hypothetical protein E5V56_07785, partial [Mesorhizobium sp.]